jgi:hypothetical protein
MHHAGRSETDAKIRAWRRDATHCLSWFVAVPPGIGFRFIGSMAQMVGGFTPRQRRPLQCRGS